MMVCLDLIRSLVPVKMAGIHVAKRLLIPRILLQKQSRKWNIQHVPVLEIKLQPVTFFVFALKMICILDPRKAVQHREQILCVANVLLV